jgi:biopolymer transport protein ExbD
MSKFKKDTKRKSPGISTASLPDIVFMLLFFFMVSAVIKNDNIKVEIVQPKASEVTRLKKKSAVEYIYAGKALDPGTYGTLTSVQIDDEIVPDETRIVPWVQKKRAKRSEREVLDMIAALKVDKTVKMNTVSKIENELRNANQLKICYLTAKDN